jgi:hypothetical protein
MLGEDKPIHTCCKKSVVPKQNHHDRYWLLVKSLKEKTQRYFAGSVFGFLKMFHGHFKFAGHTTYGCVNEE